MAMLNNQRVSKQVQLLLYRVFKESNYIYTYISIIYKSIRMKGWPTTNTWVASFIFKRSSTGTSFMGDESEGTETTNIRLRLNNSLGPKHRERERDHDDKKKEIAGTDFSQTKPCGNRSDVIYKSNTGNSLLIPFSIFISPSCREHKNKNFPCETHGFPLAFWMLTEGYALYCRQCSPVYI